jgi:hypothetical protein
MSSKKGNIIELFVDKAVLTIAGLIALVILFVYVIGNPTSIEYAGREYGPKEIDISINKNAQRLQEQLKNEPNTANRYEPQKPQYLLLLENSIQQTINTEIKFPLPGYPDKTIMSKNKVYRIPSMPVLDKPSVAVVRIAAFVPTEELSTSVTYENAKTKLEDVDLVTVESAINVKQLYDAFRESFAGRNLPKEWWMEQYAKPVFAKVELQKRVQQPDGNWSDWIEVPRTKICHIKKGLQIPQEASEYGMEIALVQFAKPEFRNEILQPPVYHNAIPTKLWISPSFYNEREKTIAKQREETRRQEIEAEKARKLQERATQPGRQPTTRQSVRSGGTGISEETDSSRTSPASTGRTPAVSRKTTRDTTPITEEQTQYINEEIKFDAIRLTPDTNPTELEKIVFWAHDDTTKPGEKYQYRIRIGVFNPVAGRGWVSEDQKDLRDQIVLWSNFTELGEVIEIPQRLLFFATGIREIEKSTGVDRTVEIMVAKYLLGNWVSRTFNIKNGEEIGQIVETAGDLRFEQMGIIGDTIDFSTGAVIVDVQKVTEWIGSGSLRPREYSELLYSSDGKTIEKMAIKERYWPAKIVKTYKEISEALAADPITPLTWSQAASDDGRQIQQRTRTSPEYMSPGEGGE